ncbi:MAG: M48 family metalloprotease [Elainella sp. C42_A2020_010]|nr:M48 family metalloprotease [Elainella sp. C42_A2020_010]RNJ67655.1 MAG: hypothetical protein EDM05_19230 [Leptolyngbya sp. IPPAS B-1204]
MQIKHRLRSKRRWYRVGAAVLAGWHLVSSGLVAGLVELAAQVWGMAMAQPWLLVSVMLLVAPGAIVLLLRRHILRADNERMAGVSCRYLQGLNGLSVLIWLGWIGLSLTAESSHLLNSALGSEQNLWRASFELGLVVVPPVGAIASCYRLSYPVLVRIGQPVWTQSEWVWQVVWEQFRAFVPLVLFFGGSRFVFTQQFGLAVAWLGAACLSRILLTEWAERTSSPTPQALTSGELRDRIFALAQRAGIPLKQIYLMPSAKAQGANAFAIQGNSLLLTTDLLRYLNKREIDAIVAHELAHLQYRHPQILQAILVVVVVAIMISTSVAAIGGTSLLLTPVAGIVLLWLYYAYARRFEYAADRQAAWLTCDPTPLITGLVKLAHLSHTPLDAAQWGVLTTHPSVQQRLASLGYYYDISPNQIQQLLACLDWQTNCYALPEQKGLLFSTSFKQKAAFWFTGWVVGSLVLPPTLAAVIAQQHWSLTAHGLLHLAGLIGMLALLHIGLNCAPFWGYAKLKQHLRQKLQPNWQQSGIALADGLFVGLAPAASNRLYEGVPVWDMGFLTLCGDVLCYVGEQAQFGLQANQITQISYAKSSLGWWPTTALELTWQTQGQPCRKLKLQPYDVSSRRQLTHRVQQLKQQIESWHAEFMPCPQEATPLSHVALPPPNWGAVTSQAVDRRMAAQQLCRYLGLLVPVTVGVSIVLHLPWGWQPGSWLYIMMAGGLGAIVQVLPLCLDSDP